MTPEIKGLLAPRPGPFPFLPLNEARGLTFWRSALIKQLWEEGAAKRPQDLRLSTWGHIPSEYGTSPTMIQPVSS